MRPIPALASGVLFAVGSVLLIGGTHGVAQMLAVLFVGGVVAYFVSDTIAAVIARVRRGS